MQVWMLQVRIQDFGREVRNQDLGGVIAPLQPPRSATGLQSWNTLNRKTQNQNYENWTVVQDQDWDVLWYIYI